MTKRRVVITGIGAFTPLGQTAEETWQKMLQGESAIGLIEHMDASELPVQIAASVKDFDPQDYMDRKVARRTARFTQFAIAASQMAIDDAHLDISKEDPARIGLEIGSAIGAVDIFEEQTMILNTKGASRVAPLLVPMVMINAASCQVAVLHGIQGPTNSPVAACATGTYALGLATRHLQHGYADVMLAGGTEACISPLGITSFGRIGALSNRTQDPSTACRPFDASRDGTVMGEGAAILVLETLEHALERGAHILAEVVGYGTSGDGYHMTAPSPEGDGAARAMQLALEDAQLSPGDVDYIAAHGTGTPLNDVTETRAIKQTFNSHAKGLAISSNKSMLGHMFGAAGSISVITSVLAMRDNILPPTINLYDPDPDCDLDYVPLKARPAELNVAMANAFGFGGQNATLAIRRFGV